MNIAAADYRNVFADNDSGLAHRLHRSDGRRIIYGKDRRRHIALGQPLFHSAISIRFHQTAFADQRFVERDLVIGKRLFVTLKPLFTRRGRSTAQVSDPFVPEANEVLGREPPDLDVVGRDHGAIQSFERAVDEHDLGPAADHFSIQLGPGSRYAGGDYQTVGSQQQSLDLADFAANVFLGIAYDN